MTQIDLTGISYFLPLLSFLVVFIIVFAVFQKTKIFESKWLQVFISFVFATVFVTFTGARDYVLTIVPLFVIVTICLFCLLFLISFIGKPVEGVDKTFGYIFLIILALGFLVSAFFIFSSSLSSYLPGANSSGANADVIRFTNWLYSSKVAGGLLLVAVSALVSWLVVNNK